jgi:hypothetical protein
MGLQISQIRERIERHRRNWKEHVDSISSERIPKKKRVLNYKSNKKFSGSVWIDGRILFVVFVTDAHRSNIGKDDDDVDTIFTVLQR